MDGSTILTREWPDADLSLDIAIKEVSEAFRVQLPQTAVEWADENFYLSAESSGTVGRWQTLAYQVAILNTMGSPDVPRVNVFKSARIGYTKMLMAAVGYFCVKKKRSVALWQPTDSDRDEFVKDEIETAIRDVGVWNAAFPAFSKKSPENTIDRKAFIGSTLWLKGATSAKNFRRITPDVVALDEIDAMPLDVDGEGSAEALSWKRAEVSSFRKQIIGSSPKETGSSQIENAANKADALLRFQVECPHCGAFGPLEFGGKGSSHGFKWDKDDPRSVLHHCRDCGSGWPNSDLYQASSTGYWRDEKTGYETKDGIVWRKDGEPCLAPRHVAFHIWSAYSPYASWSEIVEDWIGAQSDPLALKAFVNTTLGETWEAVEGEQVKPAQLKARDRDEMPDDLVLVTCGVDVQPDRFEVQHFGFNAKGDFATLAYKIVPAETDRLEDWKARLVPVMERTFSLNGRDLSAEAIGVDTGGSATQTAYDFCALFADRHVLALKGVGGDKPVMPPKPSRNWRKVGLDGWTVGVNAAKDIIMSAIAREDGDGRMLFPADVELPPDYFDQLLAERRVLKIRQNRKTYQYEKRSQSARNEALDTAVYAIAAAQWLKVHRRVDLVERSLNDDAKNSGFGMF